MYCLTITGKFLELVSRQTGFDVLSDSPWWYFRTKLITEILTGIPVNVQNLSDYFQL